MPGMDETDVVIVGAGFAGIGMGVKLAQAGRRFRIFEKARRVGGVWRENHYPGCACDVESHVYSYSFAPNPEWSRTYAPQAEIWAYLERCVERFGLAPHLALGQGVRSARFDEARARWIVETDDGAKIAARALVAAAGGLTRPTPPEIGGLDRYAGKMFHSARWDDSFDLAGKTVAVIGTGASAIQIVPTIAPRVKKLSVFQRTPPWIVPRNDGPISPAWRSLFRRVPLAQRAARAGMFARRELIRFAFDTGSPLSRVATKIARDHLAQQVADPALRAKLLPGYTIGCKRILISNDYYPALCRPNVELVTDRIEALTEGGVRTVDGAERAFDAVVLATGFEAAEAVAPFSLFGRGGRSLEAEWGREGAEAYRGTTVSGFPGFFLVIGPNTGLGHGSMIAMMEAQFAYIEDALRQADARGVPAFDVKRSAQDRYNEALRARLAHTVWTEGGCVSWYRTKSGKNTTLYPGTMTRFRWELRRFDPAAYETVAPKGAEQEIGSRVAAPA